MGLWPGSLEGLVTRRSVDGQTGPEPVPDIHA